MCLYPVNFDGQQVACRTCEECIETRVQGWMSRAIAESTVTPFTLSLTLTYAPLPDGSEPLGAQQFRYKDVQTFINRIRTLYRDEAKRTNTEPPVIRYLACGEQGSKGTQRIHWHLVLFCSQDIREVGSWFDYEGRQMWPVPLEKMVYCDLWEHGHVKLQQPSEKGIRYALKYVLKDQFSSAKSKGQTRETISLPFAASMFRMSKKPPIGFPFLQKIMDDHQRDGTLPPKLEFKIPGSKGYLRPSGVLRDYVLNRCHDILREVQAEGRSPAAWTSLLKSVDTRGLGINKDLETLIYGTEVEELTEEELAEQSQRDFDALKKDIRSRQDSAKRVDAARDTIARCGHVTACEWCRVAKTYDELRALDTAEAVEAYDLCDKYGLKAPYVAEDGFLEVPEAKRLKQLRRKDGELRPSGGCVVKSEPLTLEAFRNYNTKVRQTGAVTEASGRNSESKAAKPHKRREN